ncbi:MAG: putative glycoside hydrolase 5 [Phormidium sp. OSCR]|nr:MAG: putative glycoside hydrolase 5 [Phormidium sp. OSCR]
MVTTTRRAAEITLVADETQKLLDWVEAVQASDETIFHKSQQIARRLGAYYRPDGLTEIGFWVPELSPGEIQPKNIYLEIFTPLEDVHPNQDLQTVKFRREYVNLERDGEYMWGVLSGMKAGDANHFGSFYWLRYLDYDNDISTIGDFLADSLPYGVYAPAELYDRDKLQRDRRDTAYFQQFRSDDGRPVKVKPPTNILQLHVNTASPNGYLSGLTQLFQRISDKLAKGDPLTPAEENYVGYEAVQLLPIEPTVEYLGHRDHGQGFFSCSDEDRLRMDPDSESIEYESDEIHVQLKKPDTQNWGYDIVIFGMAATNPSVLETQRPDEVVEFIETLHNFSTGPIQVVYDIVYGHADNQALNLLNGRFLKGPNMYGQDVNHQNPGVRAILLEMQRRKSDTGVDGIRVDGAQDFKYFNPMSGRVEYDDVYLQEMARVPQDIADSSRYPFTIFEDGRPWPAEGWEEISTYRDIIEFLPESFQWGPLVFAHNTPSLQKFWSRKWKRVCEVMQVGSNWITGCGNHDTLRRGTQVDPEMPINWNLGKTLPEVINNAYDNPAITMLVYGFSPGLPMDFINCTMRAPWGFLRNTDDRYGVKVVAEETGFLDWQVEPEVYDLSGIFPRLKRMGFKKVGELRQFMRGLQHAIEETDYDLDEVAEICQRHLGATSDSAEAQEEAKTLTSAAQWQKLNVPEKSPILQELDVGTLKEFATNFMEDAHEICNVWNHEQFLDPQQTNYNRQLRQFRLDRPWLRENFAPRDRFNHIDEETATLYYGLRTSPDETEQVAIATHMGGDPLTVTLADWLQLDLDEWEIALASPGLEISDLRTLTLSDSQGVLLTRANR